MLHSLAVIPIQCIIDLKKSFVYKWKQKLVLDRAKYDIWKKYLQEWENLCDGELGPVNWPSVENYIRPTFSSSSANDSLDQLNLIATRVQLLKGKPWANIYCNFLGHS